MRVRSIPLALALLPACGPGHADPDLDLDPDPDPVEFADGRTLVHEYVLHYRAKRVDLILVIDDSPSMRQFQPRWAANIPELVAGTESLDHEDLAVDLRIAITTTSVPGPTCSGARALGGGPIVESCRAHLDDFVGPDEHAPLAAAEDLRSLCEDACSLAAISRIPSTGHDEHDLDALALRPWIEAPHNRFGGNLDGVTLTEALTCAGLQGFRGCSFESPIEAAARMVERLGDPGDPMAEFRRDDALLMIVMIGDEDDCSHSDAHATIFDPAGTRTFWPDPAAEQPTSAICARASVECDDQTCTLTDHDLDGNPTSDPSSAVLTAPSRLHNALEAAGELSKPIHALDWEPPAVVIVGGFDHAGEVDYTTPSAELEPSEQDYLDRFGVVPGCFDDQPYDLPTLLAGVGGRLAAAGADELLSICHADWTYAFMAMAQQIQGPVYPHCLEFECVADLDPLDPLLVPDCVFEEVDYQGARTALPACVRDDAGWVIDPETLDYTLPADANQCWGWRTDPGMLSEDWADDMHFPCMDAGLVGDLILASRPESRPYLPHDSHYEVRCRPCAG